MRKYWIINILLIIITHLFSCFVTKESIISINIYSFSGYLISTLVIGISLSLVLSPFFFKEFPFFRRLIKLLAIGILVGVIYNTIGIGIVSYEIWNINKTILNPNNFKMAV